MHRPGDSSRRCRLPEISRFLGIVIRMYYREHGPPHFHATYGSASAQIRISPPGLLDGHLPPRVLAIVVEWDSLLKQNCVRTGAVSVITRTHSPSHLWPK